VKMVFWINVFCAAVNLAAFVVAIREVVRQRKRDRLMKLLNAIDDAAKEHRRRAHERLRELGIYTTEDLARLGETERERWKN